MQRFFSILLIILLLLVQSAGASSVQEAGHSLVYRWDGERQRLFDYRQRLAALPGLPTDTHLKIVGRDQQFGIVWEIDRPLVQARKMAEEQNASLRRAGLKPVQVTPKNSYYHLYHLLYRRDSNPENLRREYARIKTALGPQAGAKLAIEQLDGRTYGLVYRGWQSRSAALKTGKQQAARLGLKTPSLLAAVERRAVHSDPKKDTVRGQIALPPTVPSPAQSNRALKAAIAEPSHSTANSATSPPTAGKQPQTRSAATLNNKVGIYLRQVADKGGIRPGERTALAAYDLTSDRYLVDINAHRSFQAASMIKPFVALAFFHQVSKGKATYTAQHRQMMEAMIQQSSNPATNWFIRQLGGPSRCEALLKKEYGHLLQRVVIREYIPPDGRTYKNTALPADYIRYLKALWNHQLPHSKEMLRVMALPGPDRLLYGTDISRATNVYNKTGTTALLCGDMGIMVARTKDGRKVPYAVVGIVERPARPANYKQWMRSSGGVIRGFSSLVYEEMKQQHNLL